MLKVYSHLGMATERVTRNLTGPEPLETVPKPKPFVTGSEPRNRETARKKLPEPWNRRKKNVWTRPKNRRPEPKPKPVQVNRPNGSMESEPEPVRVNRLNGSMESEPETVRVNWPSGSMEPEPEI